MSGRLVYRVVANYDYFPFDTTSAMTKVDRGSRVERLFLRYKSS